MAYTDVESGDIKYRVILGKHDGIIPAEQLPGDCTGLLIEYAADHQEALWTFYMGRTILGNLANDSYAQFYRELFRSIQDKQLPLAMAEPLYTQPDPPELKPNLNWLPDTFLPTLDSALDEILRTAGEATELPKESEHFRRYLRLAQFINQLSDPFFAVELRDLVMAQRAYAFANHQIEQEGINNPYLALACGALHPGIVPALEFSANLRVTAIKNHPLFNTLFKPDRSNIVSFAKYDQKLSSYMLGHFTDPALS